MNPVIDPFVMEAAGTASGKKALHASITTTLYDLMLALQDSAGPEHEELVVPIMVHLQRSGRLKWAHEVPDDMRCSVSL